MTRRPLLLDLFCGAGGAAMGYSRAGFDVVGVDIKPQPHYPFDFEQAEAIHFMRDGVKDWYFRVDAIHASPPCQAYSTTRALHTADYPLLVEEVRRLVDESGLPYIIENVQGAPLLRQATFDRPTSAGVRLCGSSFGLGVRRHRLFETNFPIAGLPCRHELQPEPIDVTGTGGPAYRAPYGNGGEHRKPRRLREAREAMGIEWMTRRELSEAVPPPYTHLLGEQLLEHLNRSKVTA